MCGIAGYYATNNIFNHSELDKVGESIASRGPEHQGVSHDDIVGLVHRRLKIIDLSDESNQPMFSKDERFVIVYNGEIYNYDEIRREIPMELRTKSDTEVVLQALVACGTSAIESFNGMFAIAFYDTLEKKLLLIRDRMGVKPLYYYWDGNNFAFASEIKALLQFNFINKKKSVNYTALNQYLHLGYTGLEYTIYEHIYKVPAGSYMEISRDGISIHSYWTTYNCIEGETINDFYSAKEILRDLVEQSVRYRLRSDVPFGTFLSGGIDSSLVTAVAQKNLSSKIKTFTIAFAENQFDESRYAKQVADYLGTEHTEMLVTENDALKLLPTVLDTFDEPFADSSALPTMLVSQLAKSQVTMILSGDGGDELFMGYGAYNWANRLQQPLYQKLHNAMAMAMRFGTSRYKRVAELLAFSSDTPLPSHIFSQEQYLFSKRELPSLLREDIYRDFSLTNEVADVARQLSVAENQSLFDLNYYLREDLLPKVDRSSMRCSLEVRVPLLDYTIVEFALNLDENLKMHGGTQKYLLKEVLYDYVPAHLFNRPKWGFSIPLCKWLHTDLHFLIDEYLGENMIKQVGIFNPKQVRTLVKRFGRGTNDYLYNRIWQIVLVQKFMHEKFNGNEK